jgi:PAS domain S-box-containing protein
MTSGRAEELLRIHRAFEALIVNISTEFVNIPSGAIDGSINAVLGKLGSFLGVQRVYVFLFDEGGSVMDNTHEWVETGTSNVQSTLRNVPTLVFPWFAERILRGETVHIPRVKDLPYEARAEKDEFEREGIMSLVNIPMLFKGKVMGFLGLDSTRSEYYWPDETIDLLRTVGEIVANAISRMRMEEKLRFSEGRYKTLFDLSPQGIAILDMDGRIVDMNDTLERMTDLPPEELLDHDFRTLSIIPEEYIEILGGSFRELLEGKMVEVIEFPVEIRGRTFWLEIHPGLITIDGDPRGIQIIAIDITKRKEAEFEIRKFKSMFDGANFGASISDLSGNMIYVNRSMEALHGYPPGGLLGSNLTALHDERDRGSADGTLSLIIKNGGIDAVEHLHLKKDGTQVPVLVNGSLVRDAKGDPAFVSTTVVDISEIQRAREQILEERYRAEFYLDLLSHDIGNLHQGISVWTSLALDAPPNGPMREMAIKRIDELQRRALKLVKNVLLLSRLKRMRVERKEVELVSMLRRSLRDVEHMFPDRIVRSEVSTMTDTVLYSGEPLMEEVFFNLVQNSYKFIARPDARIWVSITQDGSGGVEIRFADNGPGIPDDLKAEVFSRMSRSSRFKNTGIGLSLVKELIERYNGTLKVEDRVIGDPSQGASFVISLPPQSS